MRRFIFFAAACLALAGQLGAQSPPDAASPRSENTYLELGKLIEREMRGGEKHSYKVHAEAGQFVRVVVLQKGTEISVTLLDPSGKRVLIVDSMYDSYPDSLSIIAEHSGDLQFDVSPSSPDAPAGHYEIKLTELQAPTETDRTRIKSERMVRAVRLNSIGQAYSDRGEKQKALDYFSQALILWRTVGNSAGEAIALNNIGQAYSELGEKQKALNFFNQALPLERAAGDRMNEGTTLNNIGLAYSNLGEKRKALDYFNQVLPLVRAVEYRIFTGTLAEVILPPLSKC